MKHQPILALLVALPMAIACTKQKADKHSQDHSTGLPPTDAVEYSLVDNLYTTLQGIWRPKAISAATKQLISNQPELVTQITRYSELGLDVEWAAGEPWTPYNELAPGYAEYATDANKPAPKSILYFWHSADQQLIDEESPIRYEGVYLPPLLTGSAFRPQGHLTTQAFEAHVRTARALAEYGGRNYDFGIITGDLTDGSQENELEWFITAMSGGEINPDSGINDDPVPGSGNDFNDPFIAVGLGAPWYAVIGNHETLFIGSARLNQTIHAAAVSDEVFLDAIKQGFGVMLNGPGYQPGFRDGSKPYADIVTFGQTPADPKRRILEAPDVLKMLQAAPGEPAGHGLTAEQAAAGNADFVATPLAGKPIKLIAVNTVYREEMGLNNLFEYSLGFVTEAQLTWLETQLDAAAAANEIVIVASHHRSGDFNSNSPVSGERFASLLAQYDNVVLHISGHGHYTDSRLCRDKAESDARQCEQADQIEAASAQRGYWELMVPSTADYPIQSRIIELVYEGHGYLSIYTTNIDHNSPIDSLAHQARVLAVGRRWFQGDDVSQDFAERRAYRNMILRYKLPAAVAAVIEAKTWPSKIESTQTLLTLKGP